MGLVVQKYGGSSVSDAERIKRVAERIVATKKDGHDVCVVVSRHGRHHRRAARPRAAGVAAAARAASSTCSSPPASASRWRCWRWPSRPSGASAQVVHRQPGRRHHRLGARQGADHRRHAGPHHRGDRQGPHRDRRRLPGRQPGHQGHHHARPRRLRHHRRRPRRRAARRPLRDLHRRRRRLLRRPAHRPRRPAAGHGLLRGDARAGRGRGEDPAPALRRVRPPLQRPARRPLVVLRQARDPDHQRGSRPRRGTGHHQRGRPRPVRGAGHRRRGARTSPARPPRSSAPSPTPRSTST